jgi:sigma-B regulation protein RsbU (phosphoserine phosphatase)
VPLTTHDGYNLGTLCVIDHEPRDVTALELALLEDLAALVMDELELRLVARRTVARADRLRREAEELADALQASLLPPLAPDLPGMELATRYLAGEQGLKVGGDFFDIFRLASNDWGIVLGDACGKGARPASLAALARWTFRASSVHLFKPSDVLRDVNAALLAEDERGEDGHFCTAVFARLELDTCGAWMTMASAGHPLPIVVRRSGAVEFRGEADLPLGMFDTIEPVDSRVGLGPGDALVLYTDGITEARDDQGEMFGEQRLMETLEGLTDVSAKGICDGIVDAARRFAGDLFGDDVAVAVIRVPIDAASEPQARVSAATGMPLDQLRLPGYSHGGGSADTWPGAKQR